MKREVAPGTLDTQEVGAVVQRLVPLVKLPWKRAQSTRRRYPAARRRTCRGLHGRRSIATSGSVVVLAEAHHVVVEVFVFVGVVAARGASTATAARCATSDATNSRLYQRVQDSTTTIAWGTGAVRVALPRPHKQLARSKVVVAVVVGAGVVVGLRARMRRTRSSSPALGHTWRAHGGPPRKSCRHGRHRQCVLRQLGTHRWRLGRCAAGYTR